MATAVENGLGSVGELWRYPVKSMRGEQLDASAVGARGLAGDRVYAIVDPETGKVASAKNPRKWPSLFECSSAFAEPPGSNGGGVAPVNVTLPDGSVARSDESTFDEAISDLLGRPGKLQAVVPEQPVLEEYWPDIEGLGLRDTVTDESMPSGTFFDLATVHLLTTSTLARLSELYPDGEFDVRRFRPNIVVQSPNGDRSFAEAEWVGRTIAIGDEVELEVTRACPRCVMTTLPQPGLAADPGILRTAAKHSDAHVGIYAEVVRGGVVHRGDSIRFA